MDFEGEGDVSGGDLIIQLLTDVDSELSIRMRFCGYSLDQRILLACQSAAVAIDDSGKHPEAPSDPQQALQNTGGATHTAHTCFWDAETDGFAKYRFDNPTLVCLTTVYGMGI
eukprot:342472-Hanusia_phi.AAC.1